MNLKEFESLCRSEQSDVWPKLSQEERESILQEKRMHRLGADNQPPPVTDPQPRDAAIATPSQDARTVSPDGITRFQGGVIIFLLLVALGVPFFGLLRPVQQWEYRIESPSDTSFSTMMDQYGREGWELVSARRASDGSGTMSYECIFKRPKR